MTSDAIAASAADATAGPPGGKRHRRFISELLPVGIGQAAGAVGSAVVQIAKAKGGKAVEHTLRDRRLHRIFEAIDELPGRQLFTWIGLDGIARPIDSHHVNAYLAERTGLHPNTVRAHLEGIARTRPDTLPSYVALARATANTAVLDGRLLPIRAAKILRVLDAAESDAPVEHRAR